MNYKRSVFLLICIIVIFSNCQTTKGKSTSSLPQWILHPSVPEDCFVGSGYGVDRYSQEKQAYESISIQVMSNFRFENFKWNRKYPFYLYFTISHPSSKIISLIKENNLLENEYSEGNWFGVTVKHFPENVMAQLPRIIMPVTHSFSLEGAVNTAARNASDRIASNSKIAIVNINAKDSDDAEFVIEELSTVLVKLSKDEDKIFTMVDRRSLDTIRREQKFQMSGDVDDNTLVKIGEFTGADIVITGSITGIDEFRRLRIKLLDVKTARLLAQINLKY